MKYLKNVSEFLKENFVFRISSNVIKDFNSMSLGSSQTNPTPQFGEDIQNDSFSGADIEVDSDDEIDCNKELNDPDEIAAAVQKNHLQPLQQFMNN